MASELWRVRRSHGSGVGAGASSLGDEARAQRVKPHRAGDARRVRAAFHHPV
jgi:hypothetical protein